MTRKSKQQRQVQRVNAPKKKKPTPFADAGAIVGSKVSTMFNAPWAKGVGKWLGSGIGQIFGSGDYTMVGPSPEYNVLTNGNQIPKFNTGTQTNIICHREYLGDIEGGSGFNLRDYPLNPGITKTFPWLSTVAQNYQEYKFHGLIFEFRPLITDYVTSGAPGVVVMATNYNADAPLYTTKQEMENSEYAVSCKPTRDLIHGVECATPLTILPHRYVRTGSVDTGQDLRLYDYGTYQLATQSNPSQTLGELWVSYAVEFFKPILPPDVGGNVRSGHAVRTTVSAAAPLGSIGVSLKSDLGLVIATTSSFAFDIQPKNYYLIVIEWTGSVAAAATYPTVTPDVGNLVAFWTPSLFTSITSPGAGTVSTSMCLQFLYQAPASSTSTGQTGITLGLGGAYPTGTTTMDITVSSYSSEAV